MQPDPTPDLDELTKLEKAATPGPWEVAPFPAHVSAGRRLVAGTGGYQNNYEGGIREQNESNAALIAAARNALPWLLRAARERDELRAKVDRLVSRGIEDLRHENDELRARVERAEAESLRLVNLEERFARAHSFQVARAEKAEADLAESKRLVDKAEARARELEGLYVRQCALTDLKDDRAARAEARAKELEAELYGPALETLRDLLSTYGPDYVLVKAHRIERAREVCAKIEEARKRAEGR